MRPKKETQKSAKSATVTGKAVKGFTDEERVAMKERAQDRHRGGGHPPTPATPPCVRVRTRRFELVTLASID